jgi:hypothetical protein
MGLCAMMDSLRNKKRPMDHGTPPRSPLLAAPPAFIRKAYAIIKVQSHTFVGYFHSVLCPKPLEPFASGEGGVAYAYAQDGTIIMLTGSGTFQTDEPTAVTSGGTWTTFPEHGLRPTGEGTYTVTELISFVEAPGTIPPVIEDTIAERIDARSGLAVMRIAYADADGNPAGSGVLTVSSRLAVGSPASMFVGVTATKDYVVYWNRFEPARGVNANRANFHLIPDTTAPRVPAVSVGADGSEEGGQRH